MKFRKITDVEYFTKGHRGLLYKGKLDKKVVTIKTKNPASEATGRMKNEMKYLKHLNNHSIGAKLIVSGKDWFAYEYVRGPFIPEFTEKAKKADLIKVLKAVFMQCHKLDRLGIDKEEMHRPFKHIVIKANKTPVLLDFERAHQTDKPKNVTQFCQYMISTKYTYILDKKLKISRNKMISAARNYKRDMSKKNLEIILNLIK